MIRVGRLLGNIFEVFADRADTICPVAIEYIFTEEDEAIKKYLLLYISPKRNIEEATALTGSLW